MPPLTTIPHALYSGRIVIDVRKRGMEVQICRIIRVYPMVKVEVALNWLDLAPEITAEMIEASPIPSRNKNGYYYCPPELAAKAQFAKPLTPKQSFLLWVRDWQAYTSEEGYSFLQYHLDGDEGVVDERTESEEQAWTLYQQSTSVCHTLLLWIMVFRQRGDDHPADEYCLLAHGPIGEENMLSFYLADFLQRRRLPDGRFLLLGELVGDRTFLALSHFPPFVADGAYADVWQFPDAEAGQRAFQEWNPATAPEPGGWDRHPRTMRRHPGGDASKEEVRA